MDWRLWATMIGAAIGTINPAAGVLINEVMTAVGTIQADTAEVKALQQKWYDFCAAMIAHGGPPTPEERAEARKFADDVFAANEALK